MFDVYFYKTSSGRKPIEDFIKDLNEIDRARVKNAINLLRQYGFKLLQTKWIKKIYQNPTIFELRITGNSQIRLLFIIYSQNIFLILHIFVKKSPKTPRKELNTAIQRAREFI